MSEPRSDPLPADAIEENRPGDDSVRNVEAPGISSPVVEPVGTLLMLPVDELVANPDNIRDESRADPGLVANLKADGIAGLLQPLIVVEHPEKTGHLLIDGHDRLASVLEAAKTHPDLTHVPAMLRPDLADKGAQIVTMLRTGLHRRALTSVEEARGVQQLVLAGFSPRQISRRTGLKPRQVEDARAVAELPTETAQRVAAHGLDLHQAKVVQEFADDDETVARLLEAAERGPVAFERQATQLRSDRDEEARLASRTAELEAAGVAVVDYSVLRSPGSTVATLSSLLHNDEPLTDDSHVGCPGKAIALYQSYDGWHEVACCLDWRKHGHKHRHESDRPAGGPMSAEQKAERQRVIANNKAMDAANEVRRAWITNLCKRPKIRGAARYVAETLTRHPRFLARWTQREAPLLAEFLGTSPGESQPQIPPSANDARITVYALAAIAAAHESEISRDSWRHPTDATTRWYTFLATLGYDLADVERLAVPDPDDAPADDADSSDADTDGSASEVETGSDRPDLTVAPPSDAGLAQAVPHLTVVPDADADPGTAPHLTVVAYSDAE
ncbi:ParB/RepB/Spo0J family partition protein [Cryptosporangium sp. NPDC051539]|uniref:ParB/RepB/Spo0J family partition protein n=1 Tax=Cryptosporangium sp. NPDC051539 TaxID=3363962 RepID=UPI0037A16143